MDEAEAARQKAIERLEAKAREAAGKALDRYWHNGPFNVQRWVERGYNSALGVLRQNSPEKGESARSYLSRMSEAVRELRELGPDADDEAWYSSAVDDAAFTITAE